MIYTLTLNPAIDKTIFIDDFKINKVNRVKKPVLNLGGKGINVSKILANLGSKSKVLAVVGKESLDFFQRGLKDLKIDYKFFTNEGSTRTNIKIVDEKNNTFTDINEKGTTINSKILEEIEAYLKENLKKDDLLVLAGSVPPNCPLDIYKKWTNLAKELEVKTFLDADGDLFKYGLEASPYLIKPNDDELANYLKTELKDDADIIEKGKSILDKGIKNIIISQGAKGSILLYENGYSKALPIKVNVKSTVGAGDSMLGATIHGISENKDILSAFKLGVAASTASVKIEGTKMANKDEILTMLELVEIKTEEEI